MRHIPVNIVLLSSQSLGLRPLVWYKCDEFHKLPKCAGGGAVAGTEIVPCGFMI